MRRWEGEVLQRVRDVVTTRGENERERERRKKKKKKELSKERKGISHPLCDNNNK